jgi:hypothetical protein
VSLYCENAMKFPIASLRHRKDEGGPRSETCGAP